MGRTDRMRVGSVVEVLRPHPLAGQLARITFFESEHVVVSGNGWSAKLRGDQIKIKLY